MSRELLQFLNGNTQGALHEWLDKNPDEPRIAWYPSAGLDFAPLLYFSEFYRDKNQHLNLPDSPQIILFTDPSFEYLTGLSEGSDRCIRSDRPITLGVDQKLAVLKDLCANWVFGPISHSGLTYNGKRLIVEYAGKAEPERLDPIYLQDGVAIEHLWFLNLKVYLEGEKPFLMPLIYAFGDTSEFVSQVLFPKKAKISHLYCKVRGVMEAPWLGYALRRLNTEVVVTDYVELFYPEENQPQINQAFDGNMKLRGESDDVPDRNQWDHLADGWYTKMPVGYGLS